MVSWNSKDHLIYVFADCDGSKNTTEGGVLVRKLMLLVGILLCVVGLLALKSGQQIGIAIAVVGVVVAIVCWAAK